MSELTLSDLLGKTILVGITYYVKKLHMKNNHYLRN